MTINIVENKLYVNIKKRSKPVKYLVVHCSATQNLLKYHWKDIDAIHRGQGWACIGYHFVICTDGTIERGRPIDAIGAHAKGFNDESIGICLIGGVDSKGKSVDNFTQAQKKSLGELLVTLKKTYPDATVLGHRDLGAKKDCPCFDVKPWWSEYYGKGESNT